MDDGDLVTSAGISAGIDMALRLVARLAGVERARQVRRRLHYDHSPGLTGQDLLLCTHPLPRLAGWAGHTTARLQRRRRVDRGRADDPAHHRLDQRGRHAGTGDRTGLLVEFDRTDTLSTHPADQRIEDYITGRFG